MALATSRDTTAVSYTHLDVYKRQEYKYAHDFDNHFVAQEFLPHEISGTTFYNPSQYSRERDLKEFLKERWKDKYGY